MNFSEEKTPFWVFFIYKTRVNKILTNISWELYLQQILTKRNQYKIAHVCMIYVRTTMNRVSLCLSFFLSISLFQSFYLSLPVFFYLTLSLFLSIFSLSFSLTINFRKKMFSENSAKHKILKTPKIHTQYHAISLNLTSTLILD